MHTSPWWVNRSEAFQENTTTQAQGGIDADDSQHQHFATSMIVCEEDESDHESDADYSISDYDVSDRYTDFRKESDGYDNRTADQFVIDIDESDRNGQMIFVGNILATHNAPRELLNQQIDGCEEEKCSDIQVEELPISQHVSSDLPKVKQRNQEYLPRKQSKRTMKQMMIKAKSKTQPTQLYNEIQPAKKKKSQFESYDTRVVKQHSLWEPCENDESSSDYFDLESSSLTYLSTAEIQTQSSSLLILTSSYFPSNTITQLLEIAKLEAIHDNSIAIERDSGAILGSKLKPFRFV